MNKQIELLARQAGAAVQPGGELLFFGNTSIEKFAQLIVRECAEIAYNKQYKHSSAHTRGDCAKAIKQHFGVEERAVPILSDDDEALFSGITSSKLFTIEAVQKAFGVEE
jgi:hypothetical protein